VPIMILQPLVENAIKHGISRKVDGGVLRIGATRTARGIEVEIENDGPPFDESRLEALTSRGLGLKNVIERLNFYTCAEGRFEIDTRKDGGAVVRLFLPVTGARTVESCQSEP
jgi:sensor histidine kinase YesM